MYKGKLQKVYGNRDTVVYEYDECKWPSVSSSSLYCLYSIESKLTIAKFELLNTSSCYLYKTLSHLAEQMTRA